MNPGLQTFSHSTNNIMILIIDNTAERYKKNIQLLKNYIELEKLEYIDSFNMLDLERLKLFKVVFIHESLKIESYGTQVVLFDELLELQENDKIFPNIKLFKFSGKGSETNLSNNFISDKDLYENISTFIDEYCSSGKFIFELLKYGNKYLLEKLMSLKERISIYTFNNDYDNFEDNDSEFKKLIDDLDSIGISFNKDINITEITNEINLKIDKLISG